MLTSKDKTQLGLSAHAEHTERLHELLDPQTNEERRYTEWLLDWGPDTARVIADMIERQLQAAVTASMTNQLYAQD